MRCPHCDAYTPSGAKFCIECGTPRVPMPPVWSGRAPTGQVLWRMRHAAHHADPSTACRASRLTAAVYLATSLRNSSPPKPRSQVNANRSPCCLPT